MNLVALEGVDVRFGRAPVLQDVSLRIEKGEIVTVVGPNGSGKSTLLRLLIGAVRPARGTVARAPGLRIGYVPQVLHVDPTLPITVRRFLDLPVRADDATARAALARAGAEGLAGRQIAGLSGGQFQRVLLARATLGAPDLLLLDEPTQGLDQPGAAAFYRSLEAIRSEMGCAIVLVSHDLHVVMSASDRVVCLNGHVCCEGTPAVVSAAPAYRELFGTGTGGALALYRHEHAHSHDPADNAGGHAHAHGLREEAYVLDSFLVRAALAGTGVALAAGLLGCFVVWRRMAYFGDATAHAAILGVALSLGLGLPVTLGILVVAGGVALLVHALAVRGLAADAVLGVLAHGALGLGLLAAALVPGPRLDLEAWLFGDVLTVTRGDLGLIWGGAALIVALVWRHWPLLLTSTLSPDLARAAGMDPRRGDLLLAGLLAGTVAIAAQVVGALLVTALLVIPAAGARGLARTPEGMARWACALGVLSALGGLALALQADAAVGPATVTAALALFAVGTAAGRLRAA